MQRYHEQDEIGWDFPDLGSGRGERELEARNLGEETEICTGSDLPQPRTAR